ncbi:glycoside hydrolase family protein [Deferribacter abyssi]|uniref:glycoside hydrolase family protein n=1 Tax=Deferribacter abyssi TaxID=213806 RepID=UPI003C15F9B7
MKTIEEQLILHERLRLKPYRDSVKGKLTIGVGRNLDDVGISEDEALYLLRNDIAKVENELKQFEWFNKLDGVRKKVLIDMDFNLGLPKFLTFKRMIAALKEGDFKKASDEMLDSRWAMQVKRRAVRLSIMMETGQDYDELGV